MNHQYSEIENPPDPERESVVIALDTGSPIVSVAVGIDREVVVQRSLELRESSSRIMYLIDSALGQAGLPLSAVNILVGLRGPGSFTGLRVGMATLQGLAQALGVRVGTLSTLEVLAALAPDDELPRVACVDALRGEWLIQSFTNDGPVEEPRLAQSDQLLARRSPCHLIGYGISRIQDQVDNLSGSTLIEPGPLAGRAIEMIRGSQVQWGFGGLTSPLYQRPPSAIVPGR